MPHTKAPRIVLAALALAGLAAAPRPAAAHAVLVSSTPASGGTVAPGALSVALHFNSRIDRARSKVTLTGPGSADERLAVDPAGPADQLSAAATLAPGGYTLRWQVLATDGHITRGDVPFTVAPAGASAAAGTPAGAAAASTGN